MLFWFVLRVFAHTRLFLLFFFFSSLDHFMVLLKNKWFLIEYLKWHTKILTSTSPSPTHTLIPVKSSLRSCSTHPIYRLLVDRLNSLWIQYIMKILQQFSNFSRTNFQFLLPLTKPSVFFNPLILCLPLSHWLPRCLIWNSVFKYNNQTDLALFTQLFIPFIISLLCCIYIYFVKILKLVFNNNLLITCYHLLILSGTLKWVPSRPDIFLISGFNFCKRD